MAGVFSSESSQFWVVSSLPFFPVLFMVAARSSSSHKVSGQRRSRRRAQRSPCHAPPVLPVPPKDPVRLLLEALPVLPVLEAFQIHTHTLNLCIESFQINSRIDPFQINLCIEPFQINPRIEHFSFDLLIDPFSIHSLPIGTAPLPGHFSARQTHSFHRIHPAFPHFRPLRPLRSLPDFLSALPAFSEHRRLCRVGWVFPTRGERRGNGHGAGGRDAAHARAHSAQHPRRSFELASSNQIPPLME